MTVSYRVDDSDGRPARQAIQTLAHEFHDDYSAKKQRRKTVPAL